MAIYAILFVLKLAIEASASQASFSTAQLASARTNSDNSTAPFIFNTVASLLKQWPNTYHPNGHTIIPGTIAPFTLLYHARKDTLSPPPSPEWFAFDSEMSHAIMVPRAGPSYLSTFRTVRDIKIVYFDGMSAACGGSGWLDTQEVLIRGKGRDGTDDNINWHDDYGRAEKLCEWAETRDVEGFVRMNMGLSVKLASLIVVRCC